MSATAYALSTRTATGTSAAQKLRTAGQVPVTITRKGQASLHAAIEAKQAEHLVANVVHLCEIELDGAKLSALKGDVQRHCLSSQLQHIDLIAVDATSEVKVEVAIIADMATAPGVKAGGIGEWRHRSIPVRCPANAIPAHITADLTNLAIQQTLTAAQLPLPASVKLACKADYPVITVVIPRAMKTADAAAPAAGTTATPAAGAAPAAAAKPGDAKAAAPAAGKAAAPAAKPAAKK
ncbi:MAG: ribosomal protein [Planctomycetota bacterium]|jgi:large subunit ribosomal protein L25